jgi:two-component system cell cycle response regulator
MRILIAEDDAVSRRLLEAFLQKWGYQVTVASQGDEARGLLQREDAPKLAILDWMMPGMDGLEVCREIKKGAPESTVYVLLLTSRTQAGDLVEAFEAGADDYLTKPFDPRVLKARLHAGGRLLGLQEQLSEARRRLEKEATRDALTGLWNRRAILDMLRRELARAERDASSVAVGLAEIDDFERLRGTLGEQAGDALLRETAQRIRASVRYYDSVGRYEAARFLLVVPECDERGALIQARRLRLLLNNQPLETPSGPVTVTLRLGVAAKGEAKEADVEALLQASARALARAQAAGSEGIEGAGSVKPQEEEA